MIQSVINILYRYPKAAIKEIFRFGGFFNYWKLKHGQKLMQLASNNLPPVYSVSTGLPIHFLTGKKYLDQTLFCICSLLKVTATRFKFILIDDGSFDDFVIERIKRQLPEAEIVTRKMIEINLGEKLPEVDFSYIHKRRKAYPHLKKLTDIHTISNHDWKLVLDSDMLFWKEPAAMIEWLAHPQNPIYMQDCKESYGYSRELMEELCENNIPNLLNVGIIGLKSADINWNKIEKWIMILEEKEGNSYYLEQALTAMIVADMEVTVLSEDYIVSPDKSVIEGNMGVLHHYVDLSKEGYFKSAWKKLI